MAQPERNPNPHLRLADPLDAAGCLAIYRPIVEGTAISFEVESPDVAELEQRIRSTLTTWPWLVAADATGTILGYAYATAHRQRAAYAWCTEVSVYVDPAQQQAGIGRRLYQALFACLRELGYYNAYAGVTMPNEPSVAFHRALGFTAVGTYVNAGFKTGEWRSVSWWQLRLQAGGSIPPPPPAAHLDPELVARVLRHDR